MEGPLAGLPGASSDAGEGPVVGPLLEGLLLAAEPVREHRAHAQAWYADLVGPLLLPAPATATLQEQLEPGDHGLRLVLVATPAPGDPAGLLGLRQARGRLLDDDRVELTGVHLPLPGPVAPDAAVRDLLAELDFTVPAWVELAPVTGWPQALEALAVDGAERLAVRLPSAHDPADHGGDHAGDRAHDRADDRGDAHADGPSTSTVAGVAEILRAAVDRDLSLRVTGAGTDPVPTVGGLAALCAVRAALNGAEAPEIAAVLTEPTPAPLAAALRRMSDADAAVARVFLDGIVVGGVRNAVEDLVALGLVAPGAAD
jgi:hypothetical protein